VREKEKILAEVKKKGGKLATRKLLTWGTSSAGRRVSNCPHRFGEKGKSRKSGLIVPMIRKEKLHSTIRREGAELHNETAFVGEKGKSHTT